MAYDYDEDHNSDTYSDSGSESIRGGEEPNSDDDYAPASHSRKRRASAKGKGKAAAVSRKKQKKDVKIPVIAKVTVLATDALDMAQATEGELARERCESLFCRVYRTATNYLSACSGEGRPSDSRTDQEGSSTCQPRRDGRS